MTIFQIHEYLLRFLALRINRKYKILNKVIFVVKIGYIQNTNVIFELTVILSEFKTKKILSSTSQK